MTTKFKKESFRGNGLTEEFARKFKESQFYTEIYSKHKSEIIIGVRDGYLNLYYNCDNIAKINYNQQELKGEIDKYYTEGRNALTDTELVKNYHSIKERSDERKKYEKQAQSQLYISNNLNIESNWFCIDVEYTKTHTNWRFDIIAVSTDLKKPIRVALIELKYGSKAISGDSGISKHIEDYYSFFKESSFDKLKPELVSIIKSLNMLGVDVPIRLKNVSVDEFENEPCFYFVTLDNNSDLGRCTTPQMTMSGYLFKDKRWGCKRLSKKIIEGHDYFSIIENNERFKPTFLFSKATLPNLNINDIIEDCNYDRITEIEKYSLCK